MAFQDYSATASQNTSLGDGTYIGPNMLRNKVRPGLQQLAADGRELYDEVVARGAGGTLPQYAGVGSGVAPTSVQNVLRQSLNIQKDFGAKGDGVADDTDALAAARAYAAGFPLGCTIDFPRGTYNFTASPNWALSGLELRCAAGVVFQHTGTGVAFLLDGGATGDGVHHFKLSGKPLIWGSAGTTYGIDLRAVHTSHISASVRNATVANFRSRWMVCCTLDLVCSGLVFGGQNPAPPSCVILDERGPGDQTSACVFTNLRLSHASGAGLVLSSAIVCSFVGGAAELCDGGVTIGAASPLNTFINFDMEVNTTYDLTCGGSNNTFINLYSDKLSTFGAQNNTVTGGLFNAVLNNGDANSFSNLRYGANFGAFTNSGTNIYKKGVRNAVSDLLDADQAGDIGSATYDAPSIPAAGTATTTIAVTVAALGDKVTKLSFGVDLAGLMASAYVSSANTVTVVLFNPTAAAVDLASTTIRVEVARS